MLPAKLSMQTAECIWHNPPPSPAAPINTGPERRQSVMTPVWRRFGDTEFDISFVLNPGALETHE